jgi:hypothetical protein
MKSNPDVVETQEHDFGFKIVKYGWHSLHVRNFQATESPLCSLILLSRKE